MLDSPRPLIGRAGRTAFVALALAASLASSTLADEFLTHRSAPPTPMHLTAEPSSGNGWTLHVLSADVPARLEFDAGATPWNLAGKTLQTQITNASDQPVTVRLRAENADAKGLTNACEMPLPLLPGETRDLALRIVARPQDPTYEPFAPFMMYFKNINVRDNTVDPAVITRVAVVVDRPRDGIVLHVSRIDVTGESDNAQPPFFPFVDQYGQYIHSEWYGKIHADEDFKARVEEEARERADWPGPKDWNEFGGWATGPTLEATGFFRVQKHEGKWWFVDPKGKLFWSNGPTGVGMGGDVTPVSGRENWFRDLPAQDDPQWSAFYRKGKGATYRYYADKEWTGFDIANANLVRKYGPDYVNVVAPLSHDRLRSWGFNTIANWSDARIYSLHRTPYTVAIHVDAPGNMKGGDGHSITDVYHPDWEKNLHERLAREVGKTADDPWNIGYFVDNERAIGWRPRGASIAETVLKAPPTQPAKLKLIEQLQQKYATIDALNASWKTTYASWDALRDSREAPNLKDNEPLLKDAGDFGMMYLERYFSVCREAVKRVAPRNLFLGSRFYGHTDAEVVKLAGKYWDVISYNIYDNPPAGRINQLNALDLPILSTEWGVGSDPTQTPFRGSKLSVDDPAERSKLIAQYMDVALKHPNMVGAHFFQYRDQPLSGRPDGEATLRGYVNIVDTPNFELVQTSRRIGYAMYETRAKAK